MAVTVAFYANTSVYLVLKSAVLSIAKCIGWTTVISLLLSGDNIYCTYMIVYVYMYTYCVSIYTVNLVAY